MVKRLRLRNDSNILSSVYNNNWEQKIENKLENVATKI